MIESRRAEPGARAAYPVFGVCAEGDRGCTTDGSIPPQLGREAVYLVGEHFYT
jgi:hypothetical protein